jgi:hypothetical protein
LKLPVDVNQFHVPWLKANSEVLWGWKRDSGCQQRIIMFGASLGADTSGAAHLNDWCFFYRTRSERREIEALYEILNTAVVTHNIGKASIRSCARTHLTILELGGGPGARARSPLIERLLRRRPRRRVPKGSFPVPLEGSIKFAHLGPSVAYVGSGLSYESGLPTLASVHELFGVDRLGDEEFVFGARDPIPGQLAESVGATFGRFAGFHLLAAGARPSGSHEELARLYRRGFITRILTDNVDNLFAKLEVPFTPTRGIGIFNDRFPITFTHEERTLVVVGVAADRRGVIEQARKQGLRIVVVNPHLPVSPKSQSLSYLRRRDAWYRTSAHDFFTRYVQS